MSILSSLIIKIWILLSTKYIYVCIKNLFQAYFFVNSVSLEQWFLTFLKSGNFFDYMKNLRNIKINDPKNKQKHSA